jgi:hypothetical protein
LVSSATSNLYLHLYLYDISSLFLKEEQEDGEKF